MLVKLLFFAHATSITMGTTNLGMASMEALLHLQPVREIICRQEIPPWDLGESCAPILHAFSSFKQVLRLTTEYFSSASMEMSFEERIELLHNEFQAVSGRNVTMTMERIVDVLDEAIDQLNDPSSFSATQKLRWLFADSVSADSSASPSLGHPLDHDPARAKMFVADAPYTESVPLSIRSSQTRRDFNLRVVINRAQDGSFYIEFTHGMSCWSTLRRGRLESIEAPNLSETVRAIYVIDNSALDSGISLGRGGCWEEDVSSEPLTTTTTEPPTTALYDHNRETTSAR